MMHLAGRALGLLLAWAAAPCSAWAAEAVGGALPPRRAAEEARAVLDRNAAGRAPGYVMEAGRGRRVEASLIFVAAAPKVTPKEWVIVAPVPPEHAGQRGAKAEGLPQADETQEQGGLGRRL